MMSRKLWAYNYDFEFECADIKPVNLHGAQKMPWWFLNRSSVLLTPLTTEKDAILCYQKPDKLLLWNLKNNLGYIPEFIPLNQANNESNSIFKDCFSQTKKQDHFNQFKLSPWGWSPTAIKLANATFKNSLPEKQKEIILIANSKETSDRIRSELLPHPLQIPSRQIKNPEVSLKCLESEIHKFISQCSRVKVKHYFGASGRLTNTIRDKDITPKKLSLWQSWIRQSGGILFEKHLDIDSEYSLQAELDEQGRATILTLTRMFCNKNGSYLGNLLDSTKKEVMASLKQSLEPLFLYMVKAGYQGPVGLDLLKTKAGEFKLVEINARLTMGRIAYEWNRVLNPHQFGFFSNFFMKGFPAGDLHLLQNFCLSLEKRFNCIISIINVVPSSQQPTSLVTILIGAKTKNLIAETLCQLYPSLFQRINL